MADIGGGIDGEEYFKVYNQYNERFHDWEFGDEELLMPPDWIYKIMKYCLEKNKPYRKLSVEEVNKLTEE